MKNGGKNKSVAFIFLFSVYITAGQRLIASKIKVVVYIIYVCVYCVYLLCIFKDTYSIYLENICMYLHVYIYIHIIYIIYTFI